MNCKMNMITGIMNFTEGRLGVSIIDKRTPIIVPFAPRYLGKTCLLHRLIHYIRDNGYFVQLNEHVLFPHFDHSIDFLMNTRNIYVVNVHHVQQLYLYSEGCFLMAKQKLSL